MPLAALTAEGFTVGGCTGRTVGLKTGEWDGLPGVTVGNTVLPAARVTVAMRTTVHERTQANNTRRHTQGREKQKQSGNVQCEITSGRGPMVVNKEERCEARTSLPAVDVQLGGIISH